LPEGPEAKYFGRKPLFETIHEFIPSVLRPASDEAMGVVPSRLMDGQDSPITNFSPDEIRRLSKRFSKLDTDKSGGISLDEIMALPELKSNPLVKRVYNIMDKDSNGNVDLKEFLTVFNQVVEPVLKTSSGRFTARNNEFYETRLRFAFKIYDVDGDGYISRDDLFQAIKIMVGKNSLSEVQIWQMVNRTWRYMANKQENDHLDFEQFCAMLEGSKVLENFANKMVIKSV